MITKTTYNSQSYNSPNSVILVYSASSLFQFRLFFSLFFFLLTIELSQPLTSFYFLRVLCSYSLEFFSYLCKCGYLVVILYVLLPFYCLFISSSRLLTILLSKAAPIPNQKPNTPTVRTAPITSPSRGPLRGLQAYSAVFSSPPFLLSPVPLVRSPFLLRSYK